tara:strand:+ start:712 stop:873 length:162 start_codon:yes stop_codon:yes gene_type:complete
MTDLEYKIADLLRAGFVINATPNEIAFEVVRFLNDEYDRQLDEALGPDYKEDV